MDLKVTVVTADGTPIPDATVQVGPTASLQTDRSGQAAFGAVTAPLFIRTSMPNYVDQKVNIFVNQQNAISWTDPGSTVAVRRGAAAATAASAATVAGVTVTIPLGRMKPADTVPLDEVGNILARAVDAAPKKMKIGEVKKTWVELQHTWTTSKKTYAFMDVNPAAIQNEPTRETFFEAHPNRWKANFWSATDVAFFRPKSAEDPQPATNGPKQEKDKKEKPPKGWSAFLAQPKVITPQMESNFTYVEWTDPRYQGNPDAIRYLVGLWRPRSSTVHGGQRQDVDPGTSGSRGQARDVMVFFSPNTLTDFGYPGDRRPYRHMYPYGAMVRVQGGPKGKVPDITQPYTRLGSSYLYTNRFMSFQMLAAEKDALVIFPIQPSAHWEDLARLEGVSRLVSEAILFEHRQFPWGDFGVALDQAPPPGEQKTLPDSTYLPPPPLRYVAVSGYSAGMANVKALMQQNMALKSETGVKRTWDEEVKNPHLASASAFVAAWREVWDIDGSYESIGRDWGRWATTCHSWQWDYRHVDQKNYDYSTDRICRLYHSQYTMGDATPLNQMTILLGQTPNNLGRNRAVSGDETKVWWGSNGSLIYMSHSFIFRGADDNWRIGDHDEKSESPDNPEFWKSKDAHQAMPELCFAHAAANSKLQKLDLKKQ